MNHVCAKISELFKRNLWRHLSVTVAHSKCRCHFIASSETTTPTSIRSIVNHLIRPDRKLIQISRSVFVCASGISRSTGVLRPLSRLNTHYEFITSHWQCGDVGDDNNNNRNASVVAAIDNTQNNSTHLHTIRAASELRDPADMTRVLG